jgi:hypothetical protein
MYGGCSARSGQDHAIPGKFAQAIREHRTHLHDRPTEREPLHHKSAQHEGGFKLEDNMLSYDELVDGQRKVSRHRRAFARELND